MKKFIMRVLPFALAFVLAFSVFSSCKKNNGKLYEIIVDGENARVDINDIFQMPEAKVVDKDGKEAEVKLSYQVKNPAGAIILTSFGTFRCSSEGEYQVLYMADHAETVTITVTVSDQSGPTVTLSEFPEQVLVDTDIKFPKLTFKDYSGIDYTKTTVKIFYEGENGEEEFPYNDLKNVFHPDKTGTYLIRVHALDNVGNYSDYEWKINVVNDNWKPEKLEEGVFADFAEVGYANTLRPGTTHDWENYTEFYFMDEYEGAQGVYRVDMYYNDYANGYGSYNFRFPEAIKRSSVDTVAVRMRTETINFGMFLLFSYQYSYDPTYGQVPVAHLTDEIVDGEWFNLTFSGTTLDELANENGYIEGFQLGVSRSLEEEELFSLYMDSVFSAVKLESPQMISDSGKKLTWTPVEHASGYVVEIDGEKEYITPAANFELPEEKSCSVKIKTIGQGKYLDSDFGDKYIVNREVLEDSYLAAFDSAFYAQLADQKTYGGPYWYPSVFRAEYLSSAEGTSDGAMKVSVTFNQTEEGLASAFVYFPNQIAVSEMQGNLILRMKYVGRGCIVQYATESGEVLDAKTEQADENGWTVVRIPRSEWDKFGEKVSGVAMLLRGTDRNDIVKGTQAEIWLDYAKVEVSVETPGSIVLENNVLRWDIVKNAEGYIVELNGKTDETDQNFYTLKESASYGVRIKAKGRSGYIDSEFSETIFVSTQKLEKGVLSDFADVGYAYSVDKRTYGGGWWYPVSFEASYESEIEGTSDGALKINMTYNANEEDNGFASVRINFANAIAVADVTDDLVIRLKLENGKFRQFGVTAERYFSEEIGSTDENGWMEVKISNSEFYKFGETISYIDILLGDGAAGSDCVLYIDYAMIK